jgi:hypothetical protein
MTDAASRHPRPAKTEKILALTEKIIPFHPRLADRRFN